MMDRRLTVLLVASLVINVFLVGGIAGALATGRHLGRTGPPAPPRGGALVRALQALEPPQRAALRQAIRAHAAEIQPLTREVRASRLAAMDALANPTFDPAAVSADLARARTAEVAARAITEETFVAFTATMAPQDRQALGRTLSAQGRAIEASREAKQRR